MNDKMQSYKQIHKMLPALFIIFTFYTAVMPEIANAAPTKRTLKAARDTNGDADFDKKFREARDLIDSGEWGRAAEKFSELIGKYPNEKSTDAALYWLAFCYKKQSQFQKADGALDRLLERFPSSSWASDARVMKMEISAPLGRVFTATIDGSAYTTVYSDITPNSPAARTAGLNRVTGTTAIATAPNLYSKAMGDGSIFTGTTASRAQLDRADEIKLAAFQSLLAADPKRAVETMGELLRTDSKTSESLKLEILRAARSPRLFRSGVTFSVGSGAPDQAFGNPSLGSDKQFTALLRETLVKIYQSESNLKIRREVIYTLANSSDEQAIDYLKKLYTSEQDRETKKAIINSFGGSGFYVFSSNNAIVSPKRKAETDVLMEIVRTERDVELRRLAFSSLQRGQSGAQNEQTTEMFVRLYDTETDEAFKILIVRALGSAKQPPATRKLMDVARNDKSDKLKLEAIYALRNSKDPEVLKFLEDLIK